MRTLLLLVAAMSAFASIPPGYQEAFPKSSPVWTEDNGVFFELDALGAQQSEAALSCQCDTYNCKCQKECHCKVVPSSVPESNLSDWPIQNDDGSGDNDGENEGSAPTVFKCGCDFDGADVQMDEFSGLDCDCRAAKCQCEKQCICTVKSDTEISPGDTTSSLLEKKSIHTGKEHSQPHVKTTRSGKGVPRNNAPVSSPEVKSNTPESLPDTTTSQNAIPTFKGGHFNKIPLDLDESMDFVMEPAD